MASERSAAKIDKFINEKYIPLNKNIKLALAAALLAALVAFFWFVLIGPKLEEIGKLEATRDALNAEVEKARKTASNLPMHREELKKAQQRFEEISVILPTESEIPVLLRNISDLGKRAGLDFTSFKPGAEVPKDFYSEIPISIQLVGPYHNIGYFLGEVSKLERLVTVDNIKMGTPKEVEGEMLLDSSCNLLTYRFTNQQQQQKAAEGKDGDKKKGNDKKSTDKKSTDKTEAAEKKGKKKGGH